MRLLISAHEIWRALQFLDLELEMSAEHLSGEVVKPSPPLILFDPRFRSEPFTPRRVVGSAKKPACGGKARRKRVDMIAHEPEVQSQRIDLQNADRDLPAAQSALAELRRLGGFDKAKLLRTLEAPSKGRHYKGWALAASIAVIFGGGWAGRSSLRRSSSSINSDSGWVFRVRRSSRPCVVGMCTLII